MLDEKKSKKNLPSNLHIIESDCTT